MPEKIYISYRRDDDPSAAARVRDGLAKRFHYRDLFIDVDNLLAGQRFDEELAKALRACDVLIAIIGQHWMELLKAKTASGERDYVREEIAAALERKITVVPVRAGREGHLPPLPRAEDLPTDIRELVLHQKHDVTHERFGRDIAELSEAIVSVRRSKRPQLVTRRVAWGWTGATVSVLAIVAVAGSIALLWPRSPSGPDEVSQAAKTQEIKTYSKVGNFACFGGAEYPDSWREEAPLCVSYGCNFGKMSQDACLTLGAKKRSKTIIHGITGTTRANECWLQHSCGDLRSHGEFILFRM